MINWIEKGRGLLDALEEAGYAKNHIDGVCFAIDLQGNGSAEIDTAVQAIVDSYDNLPDLKADKIAELKAEGLSRIQSVFSAIKSFDEIKLIKHQFLSVKPAARSATTEFQKLIDIYSAGSAATTAINTLSTGASVTAYNVVSAPGWPV